MCLDVALFCGNNFLQGNVTCGWLDVLDGFEEFVRDDVISDGNAELIANDVEVWEDSFPTVYDGVGVGISNTMAVSVKTLETVDVVDDEHTDVAIDELASDIGVTARPLDFSSSRLQQRLC
jgi:hypothetical protein